jgi:hypothetical protein
MASPRLLFTSIHLRERFLRIYRLTIRRRPLAPAPTKMMPVGPAPTSPGSMTQGLYVALSASTTTSSTMVASITAATS